MSYFKVICFYLLHTLNSFIYWLSESTQNYIVSFLILSIVCVFVIFSLKFLIKKIRRLPNITYSYYRLFRFKSFKEDPRKQFGYLRYTNHFVFEEMILSAFKKLGLKIIRNKRYTGDGGIDGKVLINGQVVLIQAKRYKGHINPRHVEDFESICNRNACLGLFVHTGRTGKLSRTFARQRVDIVSGQRMLSLLNCESFRINIPDYEQKISL